MRRETIQRQRDLEVHEWGLKSENLNSIRPHSGQITQKHWLVKCELCRLVANQEGNSFYTEAPLGSVATDADYADVLLLRESTHESGLVVELESNVNGEKKREKVDTYLTPMVQDVIVLDPQNAPNNIDELTTWIEEQLAGFL